jgi:hypothetical protein
LLIISPRIQKTELPDNQDVSTDSEEEISDDQTNALEAVSAEVNISTAPIPSTHVSAGGAKSNSSDDSSRPGSLFKAVVTSIPQPNSPIHDQTYFRNKILKLYPGISYRRSNDRSEDVYNCKTKSSLCPSCETNHRENIVGLYRKDPGAPGATYHIGCMFRYTGDLEVVA